MLIKTIILNSIIAPVAMKLLDYFLGTMFIPSWESFFIDIFKLSILFISIQILYTLFLKIGIKRGFVKKILFRKYFIICFSVVVIYLGMCIYLFGPPGTFTYHNYVSLKDYEALEFKNTDNINKSIRRLTPIIIAYKKKDLKAFEILLRKGANPDTKMWKNKGETIIFYIIRNKKIKFLKILLKYSPDLKVKNINGKTPMDFTGKNKQISEIIWQATH